MFALVVRFEIRAEFLSAFDRLMTETVAAIRTGEPGTLLYICNHVEGAPQARLFLEVYTDRAAFAAHERAPATMRFLELREPMIASQRVEYLAPYEWKMQP